jgi:hypothetical protein
MQLLLELVELVEPLPYKVKELVEAILSLAPLHQQVVDMGAHKVKAEGLAAV